MKIREAERRPCCRGAPLPAEESDERRLLLIRAVIDHLHCAADLPGELELLRESRPNR